jgi:GH25 family lysozyme M1 (1,4-beta-N-acetylmuramidase)
MKNLLYLFLFLGTTAIVNAQTSGFNQPWSDSTTSIIIDAFEGNSIDFNKLKTDKKVIAIIHRATYGLKVDKKIIARKAMTTQNGLLFGSYHLALSGDPVKQADFYLSNIGDFKNDLLALDLEVLDSSHMSLPDAAKFISRIVEKTQRYPYLYCNNDVFNTINQQYDSSSVFAKCKLWYARFRKDIPMFNTKIWQSYTLWQFSSEINCTQTGKCLYNVPGTLFDMDINVYNNSSKMLKTVWASQ